MNMDQRTRISRACLLATAALALGVAGCDSKPTAQTAQDAERIIDKAPSTAAGKAADAMKSDATNMAGSVAQPAKPGDDVVINIRVEDALKSNVALKSLPIVVQTDGGVVTLSGDALTSANRSQAEQVAMNVPGVKAVQNKLSTSGT